MKSISSRKWTDFVEQIQTYVVNADLDSAEKLIDQCLLIKTRLDLSQRVKLSEFSRRIFKAEKSIRILQRVSQSERNSPDYLHEFAHVLVQVGAIQESRRYLERLESLNDPARRVDAQMLRAFGLIHEWRYTEAITVWNQLLNENDLSLEKSRIARINLAAAHVYTENYQLAIEILEPLLREFKSAEYKLLVLKSQELLLKAYLGLDRVSEAHVIVNEGIELSLQSQYLTKVFEMWRLLIDLRRLPDRAGLLDQLKAFRQRCIDNQHWELARKCDFWMAVNQGSSRLLSQAYFTTPYPSFRARVSRVLQQMNFDLPSDFEVTLSRSSHLCVDGKSDLFPMRSRYVQVLSSEILASNGASLPGGSVPHRLFVALAKDLYQPLRVAECFEFLYPGRHFCPNSSPALVYQAIFTARAWLKENEPMLGIEEVDGAYQLRVQGEGSICLRLKVDYSDILSIEDRDWKFDLRLESLAAAYQDRTFESSDVAKHLGISGRTSQMLLKQATEKLLVQKQNIGRKNSYRFCKPVVANPAAVVSSAFHA